MKLCLFIALLVSIISVVNCVVTDFEHHYRYLVYRDALITKVISNDLTLVARDSLIEAADVVYYLWSRDIPGDISEFGVYKGGASIVMASVLFYLDPHTTRKCHLFDSFEGHPNYRNSAKEDFDLLGYSGKIIAPIEGVIHALKDFDLYSRYQNQQIIFHKGWFKDTAPHLRRDLALIRADGDAYTSTMDILNNAYQHLSVGGIVIMDDYNTYESCRNAVRDFFQAHNISMSELVDGGSTDGFRPFWTKKV
jgi:predicted O-methyltransferase YrrM